MELGKLFGLLFSSFCIGICMCNEDIISESINETETIHSINQTDETTTNITFDGGGEGMSENLTEKSDSLSKKTVISRHYCSAPTYSKILQEHGNVSSHYNKMCFIHHNLPFKKKQRNNRKIRCQPKNMTSEDPVQVQIINSTFLLSKLSSLKNDNVSVINYCAIVMFFAPWCPFCAEAAPHYNALARAFPQIDVYAIDAITYSNLNFRFGTVAVPNVIIFHNSKPVARYNNSERTLEKFSSFITNITGLVANETELLPQDYKGPVPSVATEQTDYMLWLAYICIIVYLCYQLPKSVYVQQTWNNLGYYFGHTEHAHIE